MSNVTLSLENFGDIMPCSTGEFLWMIPDILTFRSESYITSPLFHFDQERWHLVLIPSTGSDKAREQSYSWMGLFLWMKDLCISSRRYNVKLGLKREDGTTINPYIGQIVSEYGCGKWNFLPMPSLLNHRISMNGRIKIFCIIQKDDYVLEGILQSLSSDDDLSKSEEDEENETQKKIPEIKGVDRLVKNLKDLLLDEHSGDIVLKVEEREFSVHKAILAARSPVFASMFQHEMSEKNSGRVDIPDCTSESFDVFLHYIYTGSASTMSINTVYNLYYAADKYHVEDLKEECVEYMTKNLSVDNFCDTIALSLQHQELELKKAAVRFFCENIKKIIKTVQWQKYLKENSTHANELIIKALNAEVPYVRSTRKEKKIA